MGKTEENLNAAFIGESQARNRYTRYAEMARREGFHYIAKIFEEIADNEKYHALEEYELLYGSKETAENLKEADRKPPKSATDYTFMTLKKVGFYEEMDGFKPFPATEWSVVYDFANLSIHFRTYGD